jgi:antitoxin ParD1/3/4
MTTIGITLPDSLKAFVEEQVALRGHRDASDFLQSLLEAERHRQVKREVEQLIGAAADGPFEEWTEQDVDDIRRAGRRAIEMRKRR